MAVFELTVQSAVRATISTRMFGFGCLEEQAAVPTGTL